MPVKVPRVRDRAPQGAPLRFTSTILPPYLRRAKSIEDLLPWLYLKGISTGDFSEALTALLGPDAPGLSATTITRLKAVTSDIRAVEFTASSAGDSPLLPGLLDQIPRAEVIGTVIADGAGGYRRRDHDTHAAKAGEECGVFGGGAGVGGTQKKPTSLVRPEQPPSH